jgi:hypothetical protein
MHGGLPAAVVNGAVANNDVKTFGVPVGGGAGGKKKHACKKSFHGLAIVHCQDRLMSSNELSLIVILIVTENELLFACERNSADIPTNPDVTLSNFA